MEEDLETITNTCSICIQILGNIANVERSKSDGEWKAFDEYLDTLQYTKEAIGCGQLNDPTNILNLMNRVVHFSRLLMDEENIARYAGNPHLRRLLGYAGVVDVQSFITKSFPNSPRSIISRLLNQSPAGRSFWDYTFQQQFVVRWSEFSGQYKACTLDPMDNDSSLQLQYVLDYNQTGYVSVHRFVAMLITFGPLTQCLTNINDLFSKRWFYGYMTQREAEELLSHEPSSFLVRFDLSRCDCVVISSNVTGSVKHYAVSFVSSQRRVAVWSEEEGRVVERESIGQFVTESNLGRPYISGIPRMRCFYGDVSTVEAGLLLAGKPMGTYILRFSSKPGFYAVSYIDSTGVIQHRLIAKSSDAAQFEEDISFKFDEAKFPLASTPLISHIPTYTPKPRAQTIYANDNPLRPKSVFISGSQSPTDLKSIYFDPSNSDSSTSPRNFRSPSQDSPSAAYFTLPNGRTEVMEQSQLRRLFYNMWLIVDRTQSAPRRGIVSWAPSTQFLRHSEENSPLDRKSPSKDNVMDTNKVPVTKTGSFVRAQPSREETTTPTRKNSNLASSRRLSVNVNGQEMSQACSPPQEAIELSEEEKDTRIEKLEQKVKELGDSLSSTVQRCLEAINQISTRQLEDSARQRDMSAALQDALDKNNALCQRLEYLELQLGLSDLGELKMNHYAGCSVKLLVSIHWNEIIHARRLLPQTMNDYQEIERACVHCLQILIDVRQQEKFVAYEGRSIDEYIEYLHYTKEATVYGQSKDMKAVADLKNRVFNFSRLLTDAAQIIRYASNPRLRRLFDMPMIGILVCATEIFSHSAKDLTTRWLNQISDPMAVSFWESSFPNRFNVRWIEFYGQFQNLTTETMENETVRQLQYVLDYNQVGYVSVHRFAAMMSSFGPFTECLSNINELFRQPYFYGYMTQREAEELLSHEPPSFLVRFDLSRCDCVVISSNVTGSVKHYAVSFVSSQRRVAVWSEEEGRVVERESIGQFVTESNLGRPYISGIPRMKCFYGDVLAGEAAILLAGKPVGSFLLRFSSQPGNFAITLIELSGAVQHRLIERSPDSTKLEQSLSVKMIDAKYPLASTPIVHSSKTSPTPQSTPNEATPKLQPNPVVPPAVTKPIRSTTVTPSIPPPQRDSNYTAIHPTHDKAAVRRSITSWSPLAKPPVRQESQSDGSFFTAQPQPVAGNVVQKEVEHGADARIQQLEQKVKELSDMLASTAQSCLNVMSQMTAKQTEMSAALQDSIERNRVLGQRVDYLEKQLGHPDVTKPAQPINYVNFS
ncbi:hypothetical protein PROFUN_08612 [Planoprotostelium fungivorum]|uniref:SH2 domain-containing protein n=1 Tax=Planoprotostelium fungivorum TaxID=1890364 RepID=A0A2P6NJ80_9EUKA|nr:hypothetical protein PROFUN_08612 [Planoprotostelium fungivorum]